MLSMRIKAKTKQPPHNAYPSCGMCLKVFHCILKYGLDPLEVEPLHPLRRISGVHVRYDY